MRNAAALKIVTSKASVSADRQAEPPERAEARPVGAPEAAEEAIAAESPVEDDHERRGPRT